MTIEPFVTAIHNYINTSIREEMQDFHMYFEVISVMSKIWMIMNANLPPTTKK